MAFAFIHLIGAWTIGKAYELTSKRKLEHYVWFFLLLGGILPDIDFILDWTFKTEVHRTITHSLAFAIIPALLLYLILTLARIQNKRTDCIFFGAGILSHLLLDMAFSQGVPLFWPNLIHYSFTHIGYFDPATPSFLNGPVSVMRKAFKIAIVDMGVGTLWIFYLWSRKQLKF